MTTLVPGNEKSLKHYPWAILHVGVPTALILVTSMVIFPMLAGLLLTERGFEARIGASSLLEAWQLIRTHWVDVNEAERAPYFAVLAYESRQQLRSDSIFLIVTLGTNLILLTYLLIAAANLIKLRSTFSGLAAKQPKVLPG
jgi:hypothetical protein